MPEQVTFDAASAKRIADAVRLVEAQRAVLSTATVAPRFAVDSIPIVNASAATIPANGVVWETGFDGTARAHNVERFDYPGVSRVLIATASIAAGRRGRAWWGGVRKVLADSYASLSAGDRLGLQADSFLAAAADLGPMIVVGAVHAGDQPDSPPTDAGLVWVRLDGRRGDYQHVTNSDDSVSGPAATLIVGVGYDVGETSAGLLNITLA